MRGYIGVTLREVDPDLQQSLREAGRRGALVEDVAENSPADHAGIRTYDLIVLVDNRPVASNDDLIASVAVREPGSPVRLRLMRDGREQDLTVKLAERPGRGASEDGLTPDTPHESARADPGAAIGLLVRDLDRDVIRRLSLPRGLRGALVSQVEPLSPAYDAEYRGRYVILEVNRQRVNSALDYRRLAGGARAGEVLSLLLYIPGGQHALRTVRVEGQ